MTNSCYIMANLGTKESGIPFSDILLMLAKEWKVLPHQHYIPQYMSFIRAISIAASTYHLSECLQSEKVQSEIFGRGDLEGIRTIIKNFRRIRIDFVQRISPTTLIREQVFV